MRKSLSEKQKRTLAVINDFVARHGKYPTLKELQELLGLSAISSVQRHLMALKIKGYLRSERYHARSMRVTPDTAGTINVPLVGNVAAGAPLLAQENIEAYIPYEAGRLRGDHQQYFFLRAVGDSMNKAGIDDGDFVLIKSQPTAEQNQQVLALIGDEATIKKFKHRAGMVVLEPESTNPQNKPIYVFENLAIQGVVKDVIKGGAKRDVQ